MTPAPLRALTLRQPARLSFGAGCANELAQDLADRKLSRPLFIASRSVRTDAERLLAAVSGQGANASLLLGVPAEPSVADFRKVLADAENVDADCIIALGGGSVLDIAKLIAAFHRTGLDVRNFVGSGLLPSRRLGLICLPTTAGAGSEVSPNAILYDEVDRLKKAVISPWLIPDAAFVDPELTLGVPADTTAATGLDALTHCIEAFANRNAHPLVDLYALEGGRLISSSIVEAVRNGKNLAARSKVSLGSTYGGLCLGPVNTAAVHALAYPLGSSFRLAHGLSNAMLLPHVIRFNMPAAEARYAELGRALGAKASGLEAAAEGVAILEALNRDCGLPAGLSALGITEAAIPAMAADAMKITRLLKNNPRELTAADAELIYRKAL